MLQKTTQWVIDRMAERALPSVGAYIASALQRMLILGHVDHHNQIEEQARRYEAEGKPHLAQMLRDQADKLSMEDPFSGSPGIAEKLSDSGQSGSFPLVIPDSPATPTRRKGRESQACEPPRDSCSGADTDA